MQLGLSLTLGQACGIISVALHGSEISLEDAGNICHILHILHILHITFFFASLKRQEIADEHLLERAPQDLRDGWKAWLKENGSAKSGTHAAKEAVPASGPVSRRRQE